ncbi:MAG: redoxin domain-containing protein [Flavobacteriales bacterium]|nr:redoxin domain-containing protein [Flavobacteriia bacterium]NCP06151.1 redoxin domain-containing protein [Flavobacteriales bacterium]PIV93753.1 MAG: thioredoxin [Flavobacteriaceae bacterium CG17_big_fil_post_rev_8_21_14_2_50_33_15]PIY11199.1 MAG: thioredoxin [Flavobacteriaceae bacterium CG_4_10_14_3_um_filter_33_47]PJB17459.1 MAG: thioredoxin [Flavobacteriaceae bacterium CG_4_9_14_3_um_filter_33_16]
MKYILWVLLLLFSVSCKEKKYSNNSENQPILPSEVLPNKIETVELEVYDFNRFKKYLNRTDDTVYVINFWATWCAPCVKELPFFEKVHTEYADKNVKVLLVSLDFPHLYDSKLKPFIIKNNIKSKVVALDDVDMNAWIPQISKDWSGSIPATLIYKNDNSKFFEQSFNYKALEHEIIKFLK